MEKRDRFMGVNSIRFYERFPHEAVCYRYIADINWASGFVCKKCGHVNYCAGRKPSSRRCTRCKHDESPTSATMFDKCKFSLHLAFHLAFKISTKKRACLHWSFPTNLICAKRPAGNSNGKYSKPCVVLNNILLPELYMWTSFM